jgi:TetR/AcrR family transcriptional repressor of nem operon
MLGAPETRDTRAALLEAATDLIETQGFCAFSYADLAERIGIRKASIHHHFPTKSDLAVAVVGQALDEARRAWLGLEKQHPAAVDRLLALFGCVRDKAAGGGRICPVGALQAEFNALPPPVQRAIQQLADAYLETLSAWLAEGRAAGQIAYPGSPRAMAQVVVCVMQAGLQRQRSNPGEPVDDALTQLRRMLAI